MSTTEADLAQQPDVAAKRDRLLSFLAGLRRVVVAYSGGVDSAVVAKAARLALGDQATAVTGVSSSLASGELDEAARLAQLIGIRHETVATQEFAEPAYLANAGDRCYHCKTELYTRLEELLDHYPDAVIVNGANLDDRGDYRPGMTAAREHRVRSPLLECELTKADVRALAAHWQLPVWDKPASPCLSSRIAYGEEVTQDRVAMIDRAEQFLRSLGLRELRVRYHKGDLARLEVPAAAIPRLAEPDLCRQIVDHLRGLGFKFVTLDLEGFRSGSLNQLVSIDLPKPATNF
ncbi:MAG: ATP-dependent sacrificial sulfur transferase LarE [Planctomycetales bacterium]|nr:ATP-dependent sacrificial sulfur transferase LarE [Planctomycetales bacterium]MBN8624895.1 ATP-dependent sacrificial sulfur transferase LarE [Planctomycetota bacterium]